MLTWASAKLGRELIPRETKADISGDEGQFPQGLRGINWMEP
jgi:hypothetical protein